MKEDEKEFLVKKEKKSRPITLVTYNEEINEKNKEINELNDKLKDEDEILEKKKNINNLPTQGNKEPDQLTQDDKNSIENEPVYDIGIKTKEHEIFQKIILSKNNNIDLRKFLFKNYEFAIKILKESNLIYIFRE